jgi:hypothetical protein
MVVTFLHFSLSFDKGFPYKYIRLCIFWRMSILVWER